MSRYRTLRFRTLRNAVIQSANVGEHAKPLSDQVTQVLLGKGLEERPQLFFDVGRFGEGLGNFFAQEFPVAFAQAMDRHSRRAFIQAEAGGSLRIGNIALPGSCAPGNGQRNLG